MSVALMTAWVKSDAICEQSCSADPGKPTKHQSVYNISTTSIPQII